MSEPSDEEAQKDLKAVRIQIVIAKAERITRAQSDVATALARVKTHEHDLSLSRVALDQAKARRDSYTADLATYVETEIHS